MHRKCANTWSPFKLLSWDQWVAHLWEEKTAWDPNKTDYLFIFIQEQLCIFPEKGKEKDAPFNMKGMQILIFILCVLLLVAVQLEMHMELAVQLDLFYN